MWELRWILLVLGMALVGVVYWFSTRQRPNPNDPDALRERTEPGLSETPAADASEEVAAPTPTPPPVAAGPQPTERIIALRLVAQVSQTLDGESVVLAMRDKGLRHGRHGIFHRYDGDDNDREWFSVASLTEPGSFDLGALKNSKLPGVSFFMVLPSVADDVEVFDDMVRTARELAQELEGDLLDERGSSWSYQRERYVREEIIQFRHQRGA
jgi:cell division protein ZipA